MLLSTLAPIVIVFAGLQVPKLPEKPPIVVQGNAAKREPLPEPASYFQRHCFDRQRLRQTYTPIDDDYDWQLLPPDLREQWDVERSIPAYILDYLDSEQTLLVKFESIARSDGLFDQICTMIIYGGDGHARFRHGLTKIMRGSPATNHVGALEGFETIPGWDQWIWTGKFARKSERWKAYQKARNRPTYLVVVDQSYYQRGDYLVLDLKTRSNEDTQLSIARLIHRSRDVPATPLGIVSQQE